MSYKIEQYIGNTAVRFEREHHELIDVTGIYGPQATDLAIEYVRELTGVAWAAPIQHARDWMHVVGMRLWFDEVQPHELRHGDIVVLHGFDTSDFGTVGVYIDAVHVRDDSIGMRPSDDNTVIEVFCQSPHKPARMKFDYLSVVGGWRNQCDGTVGTHRARQLDIWTPGNGEPHPLVEALLKDTPAEKRAVLGEFMVTEQKTAGDECVEEYDKWVAKHIKRGPVMSCTFHSDCAKGIERVNLDDLNQRGDIIVWDSDVVNQYGRVGIVRPKRASWLRRLSDWLGITRQELEVVEQERKHDAAD